MSGLPDGETVHDVARTVVDLAPAGEARAEVVEQLGRLPWFDEVLDMGIDPDGDGQPTIREWATRAPDPLRGAPTRALDPAGDAPLTVRQHPHDGRTDPNARRVIRTPDGQWLAISGPRAGWELTDADVVGWPVPHPAWWSPSLADDLAHLQSLARSEHTR